MATYQFPGTDFHDANLDWIIDQVKLCLTEWAATQEDWETLRTDNAAFVARITSEWDSVHSYIGNYFANLDVSEEISDKVDAMAANGSLLQIIRDTVQTSSGAAATAWMQENISQETGYVIDTSLTVAGAAADAKITGDILYSTYPKIGGKTVNLKTGKTSGQYYDETGTIHTDAFWATLTPIDIAGYDFISWENGGTSASGKYNIFTTEDNTFVSSFKQGTSGTAEIPEGARYVVFTVANSNTNCAVYGNYTGYLDATKATTDNLEFISNNRYDTLADKYTWTKGGWYSFTSFRPSLYPYRAGIPNHIIIERDTYFVCKPGFQVMGQGTLNGENITSTGNYSCNWFVPAGAEIVLTVRRIAEDTTESLTDEQIQEFANALMIVSVPGSPFELYKHTFSGLEMYETMAIIGDSYSAGAGANSNNWGKCLARQIGTDVVVWAQSGDTSAEWITRYMETMLAADPKNLYWINLGINDGARVVGNPEYLGSAADVDETTYTPDTFPDTFWGNMGRIIRKIQLHAPNAKIILESILFANMRNAQIDLSTSAGLTINTALKAIAKHYGIPFVNQMDDPFYTSWMYGRGMLSNHPRRYLWPGMANANRRLFVKAVFDNPEYFY